MTTLPALVAVGLLLSPLYQLVTWVNPPTGPPAGPHLTVMIHNIQSGFALDRTWNLEETARTIQAEDPDIVVLQEVSRGWLVTSDVDQALWLSLRLGMPYVFGANSNVWIVGQRHSHSRSNDRGGRSPLHNDAEPATRCHPGTGEHPNGAVLGLRHPPR